MWFFGILKSVPSRLFGVLLLVCVLVLVVFSSFVVCSFHSVFRCFLLFFVSSVFLFVCVVFLGICASFVALVFPVLVVLQFCVFVLLLVLTDRKSVV